MFGWLLNETTKTERDALLMAGTAASTGLVAAITDPVLAVATAASSAALAPDEHRSAMTRGAVLGTAGLLVAGPLGAIGAGLVAGAYGFSERIAALAPDEEPAPKTAPRKAKA